MDPLIFPNTLLKKCQNFTEKYLWFNKHIKIRNNSIYLPDFSNHGINFIGNLVDTNGNYKSFIL